MMQSKQLIIGQKYKKILNNSLSNVLWLPDNPFVDSRLSGHADLSLFNSGNTLYAHSYLKDTNLLPNCTFLSVFMDKKYPFDVPFNAKVVGNYVFLNESTVSHEILYDLRVGKRSIINVKQGYTNCCILSINNFSIITSDNGIADAANSHGLNVLKIHQGFISLDGFDYGFIGGSGFMYDESNLCITGTLENHPDCEAIFNFCNNVGVNINYLTNKSVFDIGGAIKAGF